MALQKDITTPSGIAVSQAYCRVGLVSLTKETLNFSLMFYANTEKAPFDERTFTCAYNLNGSNPISQAYVYLKTLPEFQSAEDV